MFKLRKLDIFSKIKINNKFSTSIGVRIGRPEKAAPRQMKPPTHTLFPISDKGGPTRDLLKASRNEHFFANIHNRHCSQCNEPSIGINCSNCGEKTTISFSGWKHFWFLSLPSRFENRN